MTVNASVTRKPDYVFLAFLGLALLFWGLAIYGGVINYSPVPWWDMWPDLIHNFVLMHQGHWDVLWSQHNEHRLILTRLLFLLDHYLFGGHFIFLFVLNYLLLALILLIFWKASQENCAQHGKDYRFLGLFLLIWLSSWAQWRNLTWAYQSQFWLTQLLPLSAFLMLRKAAIHQDQRSSRYFFAACLLGTLALGSMANGVFALPLMTGYALVTRMGWRRTLMLAVISTLGLLAYFYHFHTISDRLPEFATLSVDMLHFTLNLLGAPFYAIFGSVPIAEIAGLFFVFIIAYITYEHLHHIRIHPENRHPLNSALLLFIAYIIVTVLATTANRVFAGTDVAFQVRYNTPILMAWAAMLVIMAPKLIQRTETQRQKLWIPLLTLALLMLPLQFKAMQNHDDELYQRRVAALALDMQIKDLDKINYVYQKVIYMDIFPFIREEYQLRLSILGNPLYRHVYESMGRQLSSKEWSRIAHIKSHCLATAGVVALKNDSRYVSINGWVFNPATKQVPRALWIVDNNHVVVGYVLAGRPRPDVARLVAPYAGQSGFEGYVFKSMQGQPVTLVDRDDQCATTVTLGTAHKSP